MLPSEEAHILALIAGEALRLAAAGRWTDGYDVLLEGRRRAQAVWEEGEPWAEGLVKLWQRACDQYVARFGVPME